MKATIRLLSFSLITLLMSGQALAGDCNGSGCWAARVSDWRIVSDTGTLWIKFDSQTTTALDSLDTGICTPRSVWFGGAFKAMRVSSTLPGYDEVKQMIMTSYMFDDHVLSFSVFDPDPNDAVIDCEFKNLTLSKLTS